MEIDMAKRSIRAVEDPRIRRLENDLYFARQALIDLMPESAQSILNSYRSIKTHEDWWRWPTRAAEQIAEQAEEKAVQRTYQGYPIESPRAKCPLCGRGPQSFYDGSAGFALPDGLVRHLTGGHNAHQCSVFGAAHALAIRYVRDSTLGPSLDW